MQLLGSTRCVLERLWHQHLLSGFDVVVRDLDRNAVSIVRQRKFIGLRDTDECWGRLVQLAMIGILKGRTGEAQTHTGRFPY
jgi:hypothetical protein